ncbi:hypothetical protein DUI87_09550 [Hirundo rustica rustica]|uniref:Uncharacterized protein n=1 Tax=Hirundo rustica rustica TaxID=333673 RepID=A0A3M0KSU6_HIRRU|nr:hypothetical protein DUI87_09550 [Hirundo rustica rustica]
MLGPGLFHIFVSDLGSGIDADDIQLSCAVTCCREEMFIHRDLERLKRWDCVSLITFNKSKRNILHLGQGKPKHKHRLGAEWIKNSPQEKDFGVLVDERLSMTSSCAQAVQKPPVSWLDPQQCEQQVKGGDSAPLLCSGAASTPH